MKNRMWVLLFLAAPLGACGVKGKPLPPLEPAPIGDGTLMSRKNEKKKKSTAPIPVESTARSDETGP